MALCAISTFGLAVVAHSARSQPVQQIAGTLAYMAPEQLRGHATAASDQYALGVLAYEWLAGSRPISGSSAQVAVQQTLASPPPLREQVPTLPPLVERVVMRALAKDPDARFPTIEADDQVPPGHTINVLVSLTVEKETPQVEIKATGDAVKTTPPGPTGSGLPSLMNSRLPSRMRRNSEWLWRCGGCGILPAGSVVSCTSTNSPVARVPDNT